MNRSPAWIAGLVAVAGACGTGAVRDDTVVARAAQHGITAGELAVTLAGGKSLPLRPDIVERWAWWWVEYTLFAARILAGDSLVDSATVLQSRWPHVRNAQVNGYYERLAVERNVRSRQAIDSAFAAGDFRFLQHILIRTAAGMPAGERAAKRRRAESLLARLRAGEAWEAVNEANEDLAVKPWGGTVGVVGRGEIDPDVERAAFALEPRSFSPVVESRAGYHIIRRPALDEVRDEYARVVGDTLFWRLRDANAAALLAAARPQLTADAPDVMRSSAASPNRAKQSTEVLGSYRDGRFAVPDFIRWLQVLPVEVHEGVSRSTDLELRELALRMIRYDLEWQVAQAAGAVLPDSVFADAKRQLVRDIRDLRRVLAIDSTSLRVAGSEARSAGAVATAYLSTFARERRNVDAAIVPPFLADKLRNELRWSIRYDALDEVLALARARKAAGDTAGRGDP